MSSNQLAGCGAWLRFLAYPSYVLLTVRLLIRFKVVMFDDAS